MRLSSRQWSDLSTRDFAQLQRHPERAKVVAVLPLGATEQHGPHLPLGVDTALAEGVLNEALVRLPSDFPVLVLPTQSVGYSPEHRGFAGSLSIGADTLMRVWRDIGAGVAAAGVQKLLLFNAHGGQVALMDVVARELRADHGLMVFASSWYQLPQPAELERILGAKELRFGVHAGDMETSLMLALAPERVNMAEAKNFSSRTEIRAANCPLLGNGRSAKLGWMMQDLNPAGATGNAAVASADKGQRLLKAAAEGLTQLLLELSALPMDSLRERSDCPPL